ncbi:MAG: YbaK/EbsC family protein [Boseongicola sp.]|nr:MAG: YbaK/EbsC family protein [Boseongicola sp.]
MSKSLKRVKAALADAGVEVDVLEMAGETRTAIDAARAIGCEVDQIAKSIIFRGEVTDALYLFITAGSHQVNSAKASTIAGEPLGRADAAIIRKITGFAIGGVSPVGHLTKPRAFWDARLTEFDRIYAAAGTPRHNFGAKPGELQNISDAQDADFIS